jgi:hypothetical protein
MPVRYRRPLPYARPAEQIPIGNSTDRSGITTAASGAMVLAALLR